MSRAEPSQPDSRAETPEAAGPTPPDTLAASGSPSADELEALAKIAAGADSPTSDDASRPVDGSPPPLEAAASVAASVDEAALERAATTSSNAGSTTTRLRAIRRRRAWWSVFDANRWHNRTMRNAIKAAPPWLVSTIFHALLLIVLGLLAIGVEFPSAVELVATYAEELGEQLEEETFRLSPDEEDFEEQIVTPQSLPEIEQPLAAPPELEIDLNRSTATSPIAAPAIGIALSGRAPGKKEALLKAYGGTATTEAAVLEGLNWLARYQQPDGSWSLQGKYLDGASTENREAATAMALLAFQGAGFTHEGPESEPFTRVVSRAWGYLLKQQNRQGQFRGQFPGHHRLYTHSQCMMALCELYGMTRDKKLRNPAQRAVDYAVKIQDEAGGWKYAPKTGSDTSVTGWFVMGLQGARMAYLDVPDATFERIGGYLDAVQEDGGSTYRYEPNSHKNLAMSAVGLLCRQYLGWRQDDPRLARGAEILTENLPDWSDRDAYYWYHATQVCHHMEGDYWRKWNAAMRELLPAKQIADGPEKGSWDPQNDYWGARQGGGRLMVTCFHIYMLEVYYRHLPIYKYRMERPIPGEE